MCLSLSARSLCIAAALVVAGATTSWAEKGDASEQACPQADLIVTTTPAPSQAAPRVQEHLALKAHVPASADVILIGDSLVRSWELEWARAAFANASIWNLGIGGDKVQNVLWRLRDLPLASLKPKRVVLLAGTNNLAGDNRPCAIAAGISEVIRTIATVWPRARLDVIGIPPRADAFASRNTARLETNRLIQDFARPAGVWYVDADAALTDAGSLAYRQDRLHLTELAYRILGNLLNDPD